MKGYKIKLRPQPITPSHAPACHPTFLFLRDLSHHLYPYRYPRPCPHRYSRPYSHLYPARVHPQLLGHKKTL